MTKEELFAIMKGTIIVSCQATPGEPLYDPVRSVMPLMARAAKQAGAKMIRTSSVRDIIGIKEETGLDVTLVSDFREISEYCPFGKIRKRVVFFLARAFTDNVRIQEEEIDSYIWVDLQQARKLCSYDNDLRIIEKAELTIHLKV